MNRIRIQKEEPATFSQWQETCEKCDYATFFHTPEWSTIFSAYTHGRVRPAPRIITFEDNYRAIIPLYCENLFFGTIKKFISSPAGTFGGWLSSDPLTRGHSLSLLDYMLKIPDLLWRENPYDPYLTTLSIPNAADEFTQTIDLTQTPETLIKAASRAHAKALRKAVREGVTIHESREITDWELHFKAYEASRLRWKKNDTVKKAVKPYSWKMFELLFQSKSPHCKLWCARFKGAFAASVICFYWKRHAVAWHGAALEEFFNIRPNNLLYQRMIDHAGENGYKWFDCNTPGGLKGVMEFKDNLGTTRLSSRILDKMSLPRRMLKNLRNI